MELGILGVGSCKSGSVDLVRTILAEEADWPEILCSFSRFETQSLRVPMLCLWVQYPLLLSCCHQATILLASFSHFHPPQPRQSSLAPPNSHPLHLYAGLQRSLQLDEASPPLSSRLGRGRGSGSSLKKSRQIKDKKYWGRKKKVMYDPLWTTPINHPPHQPHLYISSLIQRLPLPKKSSLFYCCCLGLTGFRCRTKRKSLPLRCEQKYTDFFMLLAESSCSPRLSPWPQILNG